MANNKKASGIGRKLLMGAAVGVLPLAGCDVFPPQSGGTITVSVAEKSLYDQARSDLTAESAIRFLQAYPDSELIPPLLSRVPGSELGRIPASVVRSLDDRTKSRLPDRVKRELGLSQAVSFDRSQGSDGYSG